VKEEWESFFFSLFPLPFSLAQGDDLEKRIFGKTGLEVSVLGFGGAEIGFEGAATETVTTLLNTALDAGLNVIDTAECYGNGTVSSEELIGQAVSHRRNDYYLFTKCGHNPGFDLPDWDPWMLEQSIDRSLRRLKTDHLDLVQFHGCSAELMRQGDVIAVLLRARDAGKTRFIGYSGDNANARYAIECGVFDTLQTSINIADQSGIDTNLALARQHNMGVIVKRPIANAAWRYSSTPANGYHVTYWERLQQLAYDFTNGSDAASVALRFTLSQPGVHIAIVGTTKPDRWKQNAALLDAGPLPQAQIEAIRARWREAAPPDWVGQG
jgi:aryl-alcohol dehydrogenase-like predicted oxidoreductase